MVRNIRLHGGWVKAGCLWNDAWRTWIASGFRRRRWRLRDESAPQPDVLDLCSVGAVPRWVAPQSLRQIRVFAAHYLRDFFPPPKSVLVKPGQTQSKCFSASTVQAGLPWVMPYIVAFQARFPTHCGLSSQHSFRRAGYSRVPNLDPSNLVKPSQSEMAGLPDSSVRHNGTAQAKPQGTQRAAPSESRNARVPARWSNLASTTPPLHHSISMPIAVFSTGSVRRTRYHTLVIR
jgi:hypothetical protein